MDSLCSDQDNLNEKAEQVQLMGDIFEHAVDVVACVGPHEDNSELVFNVFREIDFANTYFERRPVEERRSFSCSENRRIRSQLDVTSTRARFNEALHTALDRHNCNVLDFDIAVQSFTNRKYWWRMWIVQEIQLAKYIKILCGFDLLELEHIAPFTVGSQLMRGIEADIMPRSLRHIGESKMGLVLLDSLVRSGIRQYRVPWAAVHAFKVFRESKCADFRDRIYAVLRIIEAAPEEGWLTMKPDYQITKIGLLMQFAGTFATDDISTIWTHLGQSPWEILTSFYSTFGLSPLDPEVSHMIKERHNGEQIPCLAPQARNISSRQRMLGWDTDYIFRLAPSSTHGRFDISAPFASFQPSPPLSKLHSAELAPLELTANDTRIGWVCPEARAGDYLSGLFIDLPSLKSRELIIRQSSDGYFDIVGHAVLHSHATWAKGTDLHERRQRLLEDSPECKEIAVRFEIEEYVTFVALRTGINGEGFDAGDLMRILTTSVSKHGSFTFATYLGWNGTSRYD